MRLRAAFWLLLALLAVACSKPAPPSIYGRWQSESLQVQSALIPIGPDLTITEAEVQVPSANLRVPVSRFEATEGRVTVHFPVGLGWTFFFESPDRMYIDVPFLGKVSYRRQGPVAAAVPPAAAVPAPSMPSPAAPSQSPSREPPVSPRSSADQAQGLAEEVRDRISRGDLPGAESAIARMETAGMDKRRTELERAALDSVRGDADAALRHLDAAIQAGLPKAVFAADERLGPLRGDVRYRVLEARAR